MSESPSGIVFGPVPSRRLGRSLGINNIPPVYCSYSCIYCQLGNKRRMGTVRKSFYSPESVLQQVEKKISGIFRNNESIDYISFVPDGEPALDIHLGSTIRLLRSTGLNVAVITNSSMLYDEGVRDDLMEADWVSLKVDAVSGDIWRRINRPHRALDLDKIHEGMVKFSGCFSGFLATETMLVRGINTMETEFRLTADFIRNLKPRVSYISIPTRPPAEKTVLPANEAEVTAAYAVFLSSGLNVECITGHEGDAFSHTGNVLDDILNITSVHPMREDSLRKFIFEAGERWELVDEMVREDRLVVNEFNGFSFYLRKFKI